MARNINVTHWKGKDYKKRRECICMPKKDALVPIENIRATRMNMRNLPNIEIANWIADQRQLRQKIQQRKSTNISVHTKKKLSYNYLMTNSGGESMMQRGILQQCSKMKQMQ